MKEKRRTSNSKGPSPPPGELSSQTFITLDRRTFTTNGKSVQCNHDCLLRGRYTNAVSISATELGISSNKKEILCCDHVDAVRKLKFANLPCVLACSRLGIQIGKNSF